MAQLCFGFVSTPKRVQASGDAVIMPYVEEDNKKKARRRRHLYRREDGHSSPNAKSAGRHAGITLRCSKAMRTLG
jgi:hypothetical protein